MWKTLEHAAAAMKHDGWTRDTPYWWKKQVSGRTILAELEWRNGWLFSMVHDDEE